MEVQRKGECGMYVICHCEECKNNKDGYCELDEVCISNNELTAAGFVPLCTDYEEETC